MTTNEFDRRAAEWLAEGPTELADRVLDAALDEVHLTRQRRRWSMPRRTISMSTPMRLGAAVASVAIVGLLAIAVVAPRLGPAAQATGSPEPSAVPSPGPTTIASPTRSPIDTGSWVLYVSGKNWVGIGFPRGWTDVPADHTWSLSKDAAWPNTGVDRFDSPDGKITVAAWSVLNPESLSLASWIEAYCPLATGPCTDALQRAVPIVADPDTRHPGLRIAFDDSVQAFFLDGDRIYAVAIWNAESDPATASYGGTSRLLDAFALSMCFDCASPVGSTARPG